MPAGIGNTRAASTATSSANAPKPVNAMTRSPTLTCVTPDPTSFTTPAASPPGENGSGGFRWYLFSMTSTSGKLRPAAFTDNTISPGPGAGDATSSMTSDSGGPYALQRTAFIGTSAWTKRIAQILTESTKP